MLIRNKGIFNLGLFLLVTFTAVLACILLPLYGPEGKKINGLAVSDDFFNKLAKDSANYLSMITEEINTTIGDQALDVTVKMAKPEDAAGAAGIITKAGFSAEAKDADIHVSAALKPMLLKFIADAQVVYDNDPDGKIKDLYGMRGDKALALVFEVANRSIKLLQKEKKLTEANIINSFNKRALEPAVNFYGISGEPVMKNIPALAGLLVFYVVYTMWYGYAIFYLFEGIGMTMKKSKVKKEV
ncbi:MAG: hypothetical protein HQK81_06505 [Desulfovibrionaceae bacterium]|nr:hypothetical protein [Desulfovibrionaceae bacterium]MBF0513700.1 hypothetical protein [Desulfovibrionaceae bacterium]